MSVKMLPMPYDDKELKALLDGDWCVGYPPEDYKGSIADWCIEMSIRGYPEDYSELTGILIPNLVWWQVLEDCEGGPPDGECSIYCDGDDHNHACRAELNGAMNSEEPK